MLGLVTAVLALVASVLPYHRTEITADGALEYTGWVQRFTGTGLGGEAVVLVHGVALLLACAVLVAGAVAVLASGARPFGLALLATGAGMLVCYVVFVTADVVSAVSQEFGATTVGPGTWLLALAGLESVTVLLLAFRGVARTDRA
ncbi:hypothetical protein [Modestobacter versicolor]|uniref:hypothetical protein n=1 Tax=Modestobacter versicolor TaxID=429133 RepID=UPI0034DE39BE